MLLLFLPPWPFFTVFKGMFLLLARLLRPRVPGPALISLGPRLSLLDSSDRLSGFLARVPAPSRTHVPLGRPLDARPPRAAGPPASSPGSRSPRPSPLGAVLSVARRPCWHRSSPAFWEVAPCTVASWRPLPPQFTPLFPSPSWSALTFREPSFTLTLRFGGPAPECWYLPGGEAASSAALAEGSHPVKG